MGNCLPFFHCFNFSREETDDDDLTRLNNSPRETDDRGDNSRSSRSSASPGRRRSRSRGGERPGSSRHPSNFAAGRRARRHPRHFHAVPLTSFSVILNEKWFRVLMSMSYMWIAMRMIVSYARPSMRLELEHFSNKSPSPIIREEESAATSNYFLFNLCYKEWLMELDAQYVW